MEFSKFLIPFTGLIYYEYRFLNYSDVPYSPFKFGETWELLPELCLST